MDPLERMLDLLGLLLDTRLPVTFAEIRGNLPEAYNQPDAKSAKRQFERDKDVLRELGVPVETSGTDASDSEDAYFIPKDRYYLPSIDFTPDEVSALLVASATSGEDDDAQRGVRKLLFGADAVMLSGADPPLVAAGPDLSGPLATELGEAIRGGRSVGFSYRKTSGEPSEREVDPYGLVWRSGHWYLVGLDRARGEIRCFKLSRFASGVVAGGEASQPPDGFAAREHVSRGPWGLEDAEMSTARIAFGERVAWWAASAVDGSQASDPKDGWVETILPGTLDDSFVSWILSFGPDARVLEPPELREAVVARLEETVGER